MKKILIISACFVDLFFTHSIQSQNTIVPDYFTSGYYQIIYESDMAKWKDNDDLAFQKLQEAEKVCPLIEQEFYHEISNYTEQLIKRGHYDKALYYIEKLASEYGKMPFVALGNLYEDSLIMLDFNSKTNFQDSIFPILFEKYQNFYTPVKKRLIEELIFICKTDRKVREDSEKDDSLEKFYQMEETDEQNASRILEIIKEFGFPNLKLYGYDNQLSLFGLSALFLHISDVRNIEDTVLQWVKQGECSPSLYGLIIDRKTMLVQGTKKSLYAAYSNTKDEQIEDIEHLDERRMSIGMPTWQMEKRKNELLSKKQEEEWDMHE
jgi:hypothetical protein